MRHHERIRARKFWLDWLQTLTAENRKSVALMIGELSDWEVRDVIESGSFAEVEAAEKRRKDRVLKEKAERELKDREQAAEWQRRAREFRAGREGYIPNAPSDLPIYPKLADSPHCLHPERTNCNYDLVNERCEFMRYQEGGGLGKGNWVCAAPMER